MSLRHTVTINVADSRGRDVRVLKGGRMRLPARLLRLLFGEFTQIYLLAPGKTVDSVDSQEVMKGGPNG